MGGIRRQARGWGLRALGIALLLGIVASEAPAAINHVKDLGTAGDNTAGATSLSLTLTAGAAVDSTVIVSFAMDPSAGAVNCSDTQGNTYTVDADVPNGSTTTGVRAVVCSSLLGTALVAADQITVTHPATAARAMSASEFAGMTGVDRTATATGLSTSPNSGTTATTTTADELLIGTFGVETKKDDPFEPDPLFTALPREDSANTAGPTSVLSLKLTS